MPFELLECNRQSLRHGPKGRATSLYTREARRGWRHAGLFVVVVCIPHVFSTRPKAAGKNAGRKIRLGKERPSGAAHASAPLCKGGWRRSRLGDCRTAQASYTHRHSHSTLTLNPSPHTKTPVLPYPLGKNGGFMITPQRWFPGFARLLGAWAHGTRSLRYSGRFPGGLPAAPGF